MTSLRKPLRRKKSDLIATAVITATCLVAVGGAVLSAPVNSVQRQEAATDVVTPAEPARAPQAVTEAFDFDGVSDVVTSSGVAILADAHGVVALDESGEIKWRYHREDRELCGLAKAWNKAVLVFQGPAGCGDVVALDAVNGKYSATRSSPMVGDNPQVISSNDRVGVLSDKRVELWRSDLVRTVEYGFVEAKQEPNFQPHEDCTRTSALTRKELLAVTEHCPDQTGSTQLRFLKATPESSREPEITRTVQIPDPGARLVAVAQEAAAVYVPAQEPGAKPEIVAYDSVTGQLLARQPVEAAPAVEKGAEGAFLAQTADLPHHMSWFDGSRLYLFEPQLLRVSQVYDFATGTPAEYGDDLLIPVDDGLAIADKSTGEIHGHLPVNREGYRGAVSLAVVGKTILERRGEHLVGLFPAP